MKIWDSGFRVSPESPFVYYTLRDDVTHSILGQVVSSEAKGETVEGKTRLEGTVFYAYNDFHGQGKGQRIHKLGKFNSLEEAKSAVEGR